MATQHVEQAERRIRAVVLDMAGTVVDHGSRAPARAFVELLAQSGVRITDAEARAPMGLPKKDHIRALLSDPAVAARFGEAHGGRAPTEADVDAMYAAFVPLQVEVLARHGDLVPGAREALAALAERGVAVAYTTGYSREMMEVVRRSMAAAGLPAEVAFCAGDVPAGRPAPWKIHRCMEALCVYPPFAVLKVGDTIPDIEAGLNAGVWSAGVTLSGNMLGLSAEELSALPAAERDARHRAAAEVMRRAGAHATLPSVATLPDLVQAIDRRLAAGERP